MVQDSNEMAEDLRKTLLSFTEALEHGDSNKVNQLAEHLEYLKMVNKLKIDRFST